METTQRPEPYRFLFSLGLVAAILGVIVWPLAAHGIFGVYPRALHGATLFYGFFWAFIAGFLMSAVPRMTSTSPASPIEALTAVILVCLQCALQFAGWPTWGVALYALQLLFLVVFLARRLLVVRKLPFEGFVFLPFAFVMAGFGIATGSPELGQQAFVLNLILGVGSRMIPILLRVPGALAPSFSTRPQRKWPELLVFACLLNLTFIVDSIWLQGPVRALVIAVFAIRHLRFLARSTTTSYLAWGIRMGIALIILGYFGRIAPAGELASLHLVFIGGFSLITLMVAARLALAHGDQNLDLELANRPLLAVILLLSAAATLRLMIGAGAAQALLLDATAGLFCLAIAAWALGFAKYLRPL